MTKVKKSYDDYVAYFSEGHLSDADIAKEMGVSRANVCKMRSKWTSVRNNPKHLKSDAKITIHEDTLSSILERALESNAKARELKSQFSIAKSILGLEFIDAFNNYLTLELKSYNQNIQELEHSLKKLKSKPYSEEVKGIISKLDELKRAKESKRMQLCYDTMRKLKATDLDSNKFKFEG